MVSMATSTKPSLLERWTKEQRNWFRLRMNALCKPLILVGSLSVFLTVYSDGGVLCWCDGRYVIYPCLIKDTALAKSASISLLGLLVSIYWGHWITRISRVRPPESTYISEQVEIDGSFLSDPSVCELQSLKWPGCCKFWLSTCAWQLGCTICWGTSCIMEDYQLITFLFSGLRNKNKSRSSFPTASSEVLFCPVNSQRYSIDCWRQTQHYLCEPEIGKYFTFWNIDVETTSFSMSNSYMSVCGSGNKLSPVLFASSVKPGIRYRELGNIIQKHAQANGFSVVRSYCGHGIHRLFHTAPNVPHYASE